MLVLVVEDEKDHLGFIKEALTESPPDDCGWRISLQNRGMDYRALALGDIVEASSKVEAINKLKNNQIYDLLILDLRIPESVPSGGVPKDFVPDNPDVLHGFDVLKFIRDPDFPYYLPVVIFSGYVNPNKPGYTQLQLLLDCGDVPSPDEVLSKVEESTFYQHLLPSTIPHGATGGQALRFSRDLFQSKVAPFLVDLTSDDEARLEGVHVFIPSNGNSTRRVLRQLKRLARSTPVGRPLPDVLMLGENGVGKTTFARAYHALRRHGGPRLRFHDVDLGSLDVSGSAPNLMLFGGTDFNASYSLGAFAKCTCYRRQDDAALVRFTGGRGSQEFEENPPDPAADVRMGANDYPGDHYDIDFEGSGTLFLDEVVNIQPEIQSMLLQAIGYDLERRFVYTTGQQSWRVPVGPTLVFATRKDIDQHRDEERVGHDNKWSGTLDYLYRIDQARVTIPPLRHRREEAIQILQQLVLDRTGNAQIEIDKTVQEMFEKSLQFKNNVADLRRIADQVTPEDHSITWRHVKGVWEREHPRRPLSASPRASAWGKEECAKYVGDVHSGAKRATSLSSIPEREVTSDLSAYHLALYVFGFSGDRWPNKTETEKLFGETVESFKMAASRLRDKLFGVKKCASAEMRQDLARFRAGELNPKR
jgi:transcriptional regulator with AAA-type ATPase domain